MHEFSDDQKQAVAGAIEKMNGGANQNHPYRLVGNAGTGKTEVLTQITRETKAVTLTPTNKAAMVLRGRGVPAVTIHSQIYAPEEISLKEDLAAALEALDNCEDDDQKLGLESQIAELEERLKKAPKGKRMQFSFRPDNKLKGRNVVIDEASMVGKRTLGDILLSNPKNVLLVGDPGQLPPIKQEDSLRAAPPNWTLVTQHRVGDAKALADIANLVRVSGAAEARKAAIALQMENPDSPVRCLSRGGDNAKEQLVLALATNTGECVWLCWRNATRLQINAGIRARLKRDSPYPVLDDRLVAYAADPTDKGRWFNGSSAVILGIQEADCLVVDGFTMMESKGRRVLLSIDGGDAEELKIANRNFEGERNRDNRPTWQYGYCLTVHKAQGSEWDTVVVADDYNSRSRSNDQRQWLYTALTRARKKVVWIR